MSRFLAISSAFLAASSVIAQAEGPPCEKANPPFAMVDLSIPANKIKSRDGKNALDIFKSWNVETVARYYDYPSGTVDPHETIPGKLITPQERDEIFKRNLSLVVVFQHNNDDPITFAVGRRGLEDAKRALELAKQVGQPYGTTIYFGVDGVDQRIIDLVLEFKASNGKPMTQGRKDELMHRPKYPMDKYEVEKLEKHYNEFLAYHAAAFDNKPALQIKDVDMLPHIDRYFRDVKAVFDAASGGDPDKTYKIGAYGDGLTNFHLEKFQTPDGKPIVEYFWLSQSTGFPQYPDYIEKGNWSFVQKLPTKTCDWPHPTERGKIADFDFNIVRPGRSDYGQWSKPAALTPP